MEKVHVNTAYSIREDGRTYSLWIDDYLIEDNIPPAPEVGTTISQVVDDWIGEPWTTFVQTKIDGTKIYRVVLDDSQT